MNTRKSLRAAQNGESTLLARWNRNGSQNEPDEAAIAPRTGLGFGVNVIQSHLNAICSNDFYAGASVYYAKELKNGWYFDASLGLGYAGNDYDAVEGGVGVFEQIGAHYKFARHFGVGAELRSLSCSYRTQLERSRIYSFEGSFGTNRIALTIGLQYYF